MKRKYLVTITIILTFLLTLVGCGKTAESPTTEKLNKNGYFMGTIVNITLYDKQDPKILEKAFNKVREIENEVSINKAGTELDKVNANAGIKPVKVGKDAFTIVESGLYYSEKTKGSFDISVGPLVKLWSIGLPEARVPSKSEIDENIKLINYKDVELNRDNQTIFLKKKGMKLDLGSIAKGYTADEIAKVLKSEGVTKAIIDLGGNIYAMGEKSENTPWKIGIQNPSQERGQIVGTINISNKSVVTSGIYERYLEKDGKTYHHILSPRTGYPYENDIAGVTIVSDLSIDGDALSTSVFSKGVKEGLKFVESIPNIEAIFITKDNEIYLTNGIKNNFKLTNPDFKIIE